MADRLEHFAAIANEILLEMNRTPRDAPKSDLENQLTKSQLDRHRFALERYLLVHLRLLSSSYRIHFPMKSRIVDKLILKQIKKNKKKTITLKTSFLVSKIWQNQPFRPIAQTPVALLILIDTNG